MLDVNILATLGFLAGTTHWLVARSAIARPLWSRATGRIDQLLRCAACSGWWLGLGLGALGLRPVSFANILAGRPGTVANILAAGLAGAFTTPVVEAVLIWARDASAVPDDDGGSGPR